MEEHDFTPVPEEGETNDLSLFQSIELFFRDLLRQFIDFIIELPLILLQFVYNLVLTILDLIPAPDFLTQVTLSDYIHPDLGYFLTVSSVPEAVALLGAGIVFKIIRRLVTVGIW